MFLYVPRWLSSTPEPVIPPDRLAQIDLYCVDVPYNTNQSINHLINQSSILCVKSNNCLLPLQWVYLLVLFLKTVVCVIILSDILTYLTLW